MKSLEVGERYELGYLPWWERLWQLFARYPLRLAGLTLVCMLVLGWGPAGAARQCQSPPSEGRLRDDSDEECLWSP